MLRNRQSVLPDDHIYIEPSCDSVIYDDTANPSVNELSRDSVVYDDTANPSVDKPSCASVIYDDTANPSVIYLTVE